MSFLPVCQALVWHALMQTRHSAVYDKSVNRQTKNDVPHEITIGGLTVEFYNMQPSSNERIAKTSSGSDMS